MSATKSTASMPKTASEPSSTSYVSGSPSHRVTFPFAAVVGHRAQKHAFLLLAVESGLRGMIVASGDDQAIPTLARAFGSLAPTQPHEHGRSTTDNRNGCQLNADVVEVPLNVTEDGLLGGLDFERTIATGKRQISTGILAKADRRVLLVKDINTLDSGISAHIANALDSRLVRVEREGLSAIHHADFLLVGTLNPAEGGSGSLLRDRVGLIADTISQSSADERSEMSERVIRFEMNPREFADNFAFETAQLKSEIDRARELLPRVRCSKDRMRQISRISIRLGVEGNRADLFALKAARANAALSGRNDVTEDDLVVAVELVLAPRATQFSSKENEEPEQRSEPETSREQNRAEPHDRDRGSIPDAIEDVIIRALDARVPEDVLSPPQGKGRPARTGKRVKAARSLRGRYVRSAAHRTRDARIAIDATLRAAAPFQLSRRAVNGLDAGFAKSLVPRVKIQPGDLRFKEFKQRSGILFIFAVDASGSMALNRMAQAKGALARLLQQAYRHRDKVALISFRGDSAEALLAPTRSVEVAKRLVDAMPAGGGTPLSAGIVKAIELARFAQLRGMTRAMLVLFTDGRANVRLLERRASRESTIADELGQLGVLLGAEEIRSVVVDTKSRFVSSGEGEALARALGARYLYLPRSDSAAVYAAITSAVERSPES